MQRFIGRAPLIGALVFILAGCGADGGGTAPVSIVGSYLLASVDGAPVPVKLPPGTVADADSSDVYFGALVLGTDGTARMSVCMKHTRWPTVWVTYSDLHGSYTHGGDEIHLDWGAAGTMQATTGTEAIAMPYNYNTITMQLRFAPSAPRAPGAEPCL